MQQAVYKCGAGYFNMVGELKLALEAARRNAPMQVLPGGTVVGFVAADAKRIALHFNG